MRARLGCLVTSTDTQMSIILSPYDDRFPRRYGSVSRHSGKLKITFHTSE